MIAASPTGQNDCRRSTSSASGFRSADDETAVTGGAAEIDGRGMGS